jgi:Ca-activated chloride channel family protein
MMKPQIRTTAALVGAAGTFVAAAMLLDRSDAGASSKRTTAAPERTSPKATCGTTGDAKATTKLGLTTMNARLSTGAIARGQGGHVHASFEITTDTVQNAQRPPLNLALVIDRSGSMSGRIEHAQAAALGIVNRLDAQDRVSLVQYDDSANTVVESIATDAAGKERLRKAIHAIALGGGTNLHRGLELGRDEVQRELKQAQVSRVILLSDGQANSGVTDPQQIAGTARNAANHGVRITAVGIGEDYNEDLMEAIAEAGRGQYHYVKVASDLERVIAGELSGIQSTVATNVELHLKAPCAGVKIAEVLGYESRRDGDTVVIPMSDLSGGDNRKLLVSLEVPDGDLGKIGTLWGELVLRDAKGGELQRTAISLGLDRTDDAKVAMDSVDKDVMAQVIQLDAARAMRDAAKDYEAGNQEGALRKLEESRREIQSKSAAYKIAPQASAAVMGELDGMASDTRAYAPGSTAGKGMLKSSKQKARIMSKSAKP